MNFTEINAFGVIHKPGQPARVAFNDDFVQVGEERGAAFVLEFTLGRNGSVHLRQAGASRRQGLVLSIAGGIREEIPLEIGRVHDLTERRLQSSMTFIEIRLPHKPAVLRFKHKVYSPQRKAFSLSWSASG